MTAPVAPPAVPSDDADMPAGDPLLGVPFRELLHVRAVRGMVLVLVAGVILVWPNRTGRVLGILVGLALSVYVVTTVVELVRDRQRRLFPVVLSVGVSGGLAAALIAHPEESLTSSAQAAGGMLVTVAVVTVGLVVIGRHAVAWGVAKAVGLGVGGVMLLLFPDTLFVFAMSVAAGAVATVGMIEVFTPEPDEADDTPLGRDLAGMTRRVVAQWIQRRPPEAEERAELRDKLYFEGPSSAVRLVRFQVLMLFASIIASVGVVAESTAVVIGAMLIAPLMVPLMGTAYGVTMGWMRRTRRCAAVALGGIATGVLTGAIVGSVVPRAVNITSNTEILARIAPTTVDLAIAVAAGAAGAYALTRRDVSDSLPGVAVAISLVPPLTVVGLCWQQRAWSAGNGALLLFLTNATAILVAGGATFLVVGAAPLQRVSAGQERWATIVVSVVSLAGVVALLLMLNGAAQAQRDLARSDVDSAIAAWTDDHPDFRVLDTRSVGHDTIVVDLVGPGEPPELDGLLDDLRD
jgi:uncharacterized hydrophobic protein (TIGR00271 family)